MQSDIRPSSDLRNHYNEIAQQCRESKEAIIITVNGRGDTVLLGLEAYKQMQAELEILKILAEAEEEVRAGQIAPIEETFDSIRAQLRGEINA